MFILETIMLRNIFSDYTLPNKLCNANTFHVSSYGERKIVYHSKNSILINLVSSVHVLREQEYFEKYLFLYYRTMLSQIEYMLHLVNDV